MLRKITQVNGVPFRLPGNDIDTDRIIPARFLKCVTFEGLGNHVFEDDRKQAGGTHPFDLYRGAGKNVLLVDENFGSGSSREHAVPALMQWGVEAIIGLSFAAIFRGNAVGNGLPCVTVTKEVHEYLGREIDGGAFGIYLDLEAMTVVVEHSSESDPLPCEMPEADRQKLISGRWDDIATCLEAGEAIEATAARLPYFAFRPTEVA